MCVLKGCPMKHEMFFCFEGRGLLKMRGRGTNWKWDGAKVCYGNNPNPSLCLLHVYHKYSITQQAQRTRGLYHIMYIWTYKCDCFWQSFCKGFICLQVFCLYLRAAWAKLCRQGSKALNISPSLSSSLSVHPASIQTDMSVNSSSNSSLHAQLDNCFNSRRSISIYTASLISFILVFLPFFIFVLYVGYQRWRNQPSAATAVMTSHSDIFTYNMVVLELTGILGSCFFLYGIYTNQQTALAVGLYISSTVSCGQTLFHLLTCVERYLAVVHPVTYLGLRQSGGVRIRNVSIVFVWLLCSGSVCLSVINPQFSICNFLLLVVSFVIVSFCSLSVLCVLIRPRPGEVGGQRERVDQSKQRAFYTIMVITGALSLRFLTNLVSYGAHALSMLSPSERCIASLVSSWLCIPSSLVLPLLFLYRAGKLPGCKQNCLRGSK